SCSSSTGTQHAVWSVMAVATYTTEADTNVSAQNDAIHGLIAGKDPSADAGWTSGNLCGNTSTCYRELDNVPHRILFRNLEAGKRYAITILIDAREQAGHPGYDGITSVVGLASISAGVAVVQNAETNVD